MDAAGPEVSVIIPVHGGVGDLRACLEGLAAQAVRAEEVIVVDDGSVPPVEAALGPVPGLAVRWVRCAARGGPARARNLGAEAARGAVLLFLDADVVPTPALVGRVKAVFAGDDAPAAAFGTYVPERSDRGLVSDWKDLSIAFLHHSAPRAARSFWSACGAVRREAFAAVHGFDAARFARPSVEDLDLGLRLVDAGFGIEVRPELEVRHRKRWTLAGVVRSDVFDRALPWARLARARRRGSDGLHLRPERKVAAAATWGVLLSVAAVAFAAGGWALLGTSLAVWLLTSRRELAWFAARGGAGFAGGCALLQALYLLYASAAWAVVALSPRGTRAPAG